MKKIKDCLGREIQVFKTFDEECLEIAIKLANIYEEGKRFIDIAVGSQIINTVNVSDEFLKKHCPEIITKKFNKAIVKFLCYAIEPNECSFFEPDELFSESCKYCYGEFECRNDSAALDAVKDKIEVAEDIMISPFFDRGLI